MNNSKDNVNTLLTSSVSDTMNAHAFCIKRLALCLLSDSKLGCCKSDSYDNTLLKLYCECLNDLACPCLVQKELSDVVNKMFLIIGKEEETQLGVNQFPVVRNMNIVCVSDF